MRALGFRIDERLKKPLNDVWILLEVKFVILSLEFDCFDVAKFELVRIVLLTPL